MAKLTHKQTPAGPESEGVAQGGSGNGTGIVQMATPEATVTASSLILVLLLVLIPLWLYLAHRNSTTRSVLFYGWIPVIAAMCISRSLHMYFDPLSPLFPSTIFPSSSLPSLFLSSPPYYLSLFSFSLPSLPLHPLNLFHLSSFSLISSNSGGGLVLSQAVSRWRGIAIYSPIINGVGGNLVAVQASRISTSLHSAGIPGSRSSDLSSTYSGPLSSFFSASELHKTLSFLCLVLKSVYGSRQKLAKYESYHFVSVVCVCVCRSTCHYGQATGVAGHPRLRHIPGSHPHPQRRPHYPLPHVLLWLPSLCSFPGLNRSFSQFYALLPHINCMTVVATQWACSLLENCSSA